jgi:hypothetical protein
MWCGEHQLVEPLLEEPLLESVTEPQPAPKRGRKKREPETLA